MVFDFFSTKAAIMYGYPGELLYKLYERKAKSLFSLFGFPNKGAFEALEKALATVEASKLNEAKKEEFVKVTSQHLAAIKHYGSV